MTQDLTGVLTALAIPFDQGGALDSAALRRVVDHSVDNGVHGVVAGGSTGEFAAMSADERMRVVTEVTSHVAGRVPVIAQTGAVTTAQAIRHSKAAEEAGADVLMLVTPYYEPLSMNETVDYLRTVVDAVEKPVMLYNIPGATGVSLTPEVVEGLVDEFPHIRYIKDSSTDWALGLQLIHHLSDKIGTFIGWDVYMYSALVEGAAGIMAGTGNVVPAELVAVYERFAAGDLQGAGKLWKDLYPVIDAMISTPFIAAVKAGLEYKGLPGGVPRAPMAGLSETDRTELVTALDRLAAASSASA